VPAARDQGRARHRRPAALVGVTPPFRIFSRLNCQGIKAHHHAAVNQEDLAANKDQRRRQIAFKICLSLALSV
jgi:hypothetical protein